MDSAYPLFPILAIIGFFLVLIPLPWHIRASNSGTCLFMIWTAIGCLIQFIDSIRWHHSIVDWAPVWCDLSTRLTVGIATAIPTASLCINLHLYRIARCRTITKRRTIVGDLAIGLGIPTIQMAIQLVVQGNRYDIWEDVGCLPNTVNTPAAYLLSSLWPIVISFFSAAYCILTLRAFMIRRAQFAQLVTSNSLVTASLFFRLMCFTATESLLVIPITSYDFYLKVTSNPFYPWKSWAKAPFNFHSTSVYPADLWRSNNHFVTRLELGRWFLVSCAFVFFGLFGFAEESRKHYRAAFNNYVFVSFRPSTLQSFRPFRTKKDGLPLPNTRGVSALFAEQNSNLSSTKCESIYSFALTVYTETVRFEPGSPVATCHSVEEWERSPKSKESRFSRATI